ncbi:hypothetical protein ACLIYM_02910 [Streptomyces fenghuangensis]
MKHEWVMWAALAVSLVACVMVPFFGSAGPSRVIPFVVATSIAVNIGRLRNEARRAEQRR